MIFTRNEFSALRPSSTSQTVAVLFSSLFLASCAELGFSEPVAADPANTINASEAAKRSATRPQQDNKPNSEVASTTSGTIISSTGVAPVATAPVTTAPPATSTTTSTTSSGSATSTTTTAATSTTSGTVTTPVTTTTNTVKTTATAPLLADPIPVVAQTPTSSNSLVLRERYGATVADHPLQFGRVFKAGEITAGLAVMFNGVEITSQVDVKNRWPDGSIKFAILSLIVPKINANSQNTIDIVARTSPASTAIAMAALPTWVDGNITLTSAGGVKSIGNLRNIYSQGQVVNWTSGSIAQTYLVADDRSSTQNDLGFDANRTIRPRFHVTVWPKINKAFVRFIGENSNLAKLQDVTYDLQVSTPANSITQAAVFHRFGARWTKTMWIGAEPAKMDLDHNLGYLKATNALPNYRTDFRVNETALVAMNAAWQLAPKEVFNAGNLLKGMNGAGGRAEVGPMPTWHLAWLSTGDNRAMEAALGNADLGGSWAMHFRESTASKPYLLNSQISAQGKPVSVHTRPTLFLAKGNMNMLNIYTDAADKPVQVAPLVGNDGWFHDGAHQPELYSVPYMLTGQYWYLEQMQFWASWGAFTNTFAGVYASARGPFPEAGISTDEVRGEAWVFRNRTLAAYYSTDDSPEKTYFTTLTNNQIAYWEGVRGVIGGFKGKAGFSAIYDWAAGIVRDANYETLGVSSLGFWSPGVTSYVAQGPYDLAAVKYAGAPWMENFITIALGRARELGFDTSALLEWQSKRMIGLVLDTGLPHVAGMYTTPTVSAITGKNFTTWAEVAGAVLPAYIQDQTVGPYTGLIPGFRYWVNDSRDGLQHGYPQIAAAAASYFYNLPRGAQAYSFFQKEFSGVDFSSNPKWAIVPR
jgi:hypothetical protein